MIVICHLLRRFLKKKSTGTLVPRSTLVNFTFASTVKKGEQTVDDEAKISAYLINSDFENNWH